jgi:hypothetical protein
MDRWLVVRGAWCGGHCVITEITEVVEKEETCHNECGTAFT